VIAVHAPRAGWLREAIASVVGQIYSSWELCIYVDGTTDPVILDYLDGLSPPDSLIRVVRHDSPKGISAALNSACALAREYICFLNQDDVLSPYALFSLAEALQTRSASLFYADEDRLSAAGSRTDPLFKPAWSPDLLISTMYLSGFLAVSREAFSAAGGFRREYEGSHVFDLCLRLTDSDNRVAHIPRILYHRRQRSEAQANTHATVAKAIQDAMQRRNRDSEIVEGAFPSTFRIKQATDRLISIVICTRSPRLLRNVLRTIRSTTSYPAYEIFVVEHCPQGENPAIQRLASEYRGRLLEVDRSDS
jgi:glycosyltransferase involved in cell wall biosynthesis